MLEISLVKKKAISSLLCDNWGLMEISQDYSR